MRAPGGRTSSGSQFTKTTGTTTKEDYECLKELREPPTKFPPLVKLPQLPEVSEAPAFVLVCRELREAVQSSWQRKWTADRKWNKNDLCHLFHLEHLSKDLKPKGYKRVTTGEPKAKLSKGLAGEVCIESILDPLMSEEAAMADWQLEETGRIDSQTKEVESQDSEQLSEDECETDEFDHASPASDDDDGLSEGRTGDMDDGPTF